MSDSHEFSSRNYKKLVHRYSIKEKTKAYVNSDIPLETAAIFFLSSFDLKQGIGEVYLVFDFICMGVLELQRARCEN